MAQTVETYNYDIVRKFTIMAIFWGIVGMLTGVYLASELAFPFLNFDQLIIAHAYSHHQRSKFKFNWKERARSLRINFL